MEKKPSRKTFGCLCDRRCLDGKDGCWNRSTEKGNQERGRAKQGSVLDKTERTWMLVLRHAMICDVAEAEECVLGQSCAAAKRVCAHLRICKESKCGEPQCERSRRLIRKL